MILLYLNISHKIPHHGSQPPTFAEAIMGHGVADEIANAHVLNYSVITCNLSNVALASQASQSRS